jgi:hypothetical protein
MKGANEFGARLSKPCDRPSYDFASTLLHVSDTAPFMSAEASVEPVAGTLDNQALRQRFSLDRLCRARGAPDR